MACGSLSNDNKGKIRLSYTLAVSDFKKTNNVSEFIDNLINNLNKNSEFDLKYKEEYDVLNSSIEEFTKVSGRLSPKQKETILSNYTTYLKQIFNLEDVDTEKIIDHEFEGIKDEDKNITASLKVERINLDDFYGAAFIVQDFMKSQFERGLLNHSVVNFKTGKIIKNNLDLNSEICQMKDYLFNKIVAYLNLIHNNKYLESMYNKDSLNADNYYTVMNAAFEEFTNLDRDILLSSFNNIHRLNANQIPTNKMLVDAFNAYAILMNFDSMILKSYNKLLDIIPKYRGSETNKNFEKYKLAIKGNLISTWRTNEYIDATKELGHVSKLLIEQTPLIDRHSGKHFDGMYLDLGLFLGVTNRLRDESIISKLNPKTDVYNHFINFHTNPGRYFPLILKDVLDGKLKDVIMFTKTDLNIVASIYDRFYRPSKDENQNYSLLSILKSEYKNKSAITEFDLLECIPGVVDRSCGTTYTQYYKNSNGNIIPREIKTSNIDRARIEKQNEINGNNKNRHDKENIVEKYKIRETTKYISASLKDNISINLLGKQIIISGINLKNYYPDFKKFKDYFELGKPVAFTEEDKAYISIIKFIDTFLNTHFLNGNIDLLNIYADNELETLHDKNITNNELHLNNLLQATLIAANAIRLNVEFKKPQNKNKDILTFISKESPYYKRTINNNERGYVVNNTILSVNATTSNNLEGLIKADQILSGALYKTTVKNNAGDNIPTNGISNLASHFTHYVNTETNALNSAFSGNLFAGDNIKALNGISVKTDGENINGEKKTASKFTTGELAYTSMLFDYFSKRFSTEKGKINVKIQPTTYSDKSRQYLFTENLENLTDPETGKPFNKLTIDEVKRTKRKTSGSFYKKVFNSVLFDYKTVFSIHYNPEDPKASFTEVLLNRLKTGIENVPANEEAYNRIIQKIEKQKENLNNIIENNKNAEDPMDLYIIEDYEILNTLDINDFADILRVTKYSELNGMFKAAEIPFVENIHASKNKSNSFLKINNNLAYKATVLYNDSDTKLWEFRQLREQKKFLRDLLNSNLRLWLTHYNGKDNVELNRILRNFGISTSDPDEKWIDFNTKELILARDEKGNPINRISIIDNNILEDNSKIELNPLLENFFYEYSTIAENLRLLLTGGEFSHSYKSNNDYALTPESYEDFEKEESARAMDQLKRNVIVPATLQYFLQGSLLGVPEWYKIAVMKDFPAEVFNFDGKQDTIDSMDGSAFVHPIIAVLENLSLQDSSVGWNKKTIGHDINNKYGTGVLLKFATYGMYNEILRKSNLSDIKLKDLFRRMCLNWEEDIDITKNLFGNTMSVSNNASNNRIFYRKGNRHYEILNITKEEGSSVNTYIYEEQEVDTKGNVIENTKIKRKVFINNLYTLWELLGGEYSESLNGNRLEYSNASIETAANYVNNVGSTTAKDDEVMNQSNTKQPLKNYMIAYLVNSSAIKVGAQNINSLDAWNNDIPLQYMMMRTKGLGVQMDADHTIDEASMTEFTQVLSSIEANGWTHDIAKETYTNLGKLTLSLVKDKYKAVDIYLRTMQKSDMYEVIGRDIIKSIRNSDRRVGLSKGIIDLIRDEFKHFRDTHDNDEYKIPFSDFNIYGISMATFASAINRVAIKKSHPGTGAVMAPGYNILQNFVINGEPYSYDDIYDLASNDNKTPEQYLNDVQLQIESQPPLSINLLYPGDRVKVVLEDGTLQSIDVTNPIIYYSIKNKYKEFYPDVTKGCNLKPAQIYWDALGKRYNIFDLPAVKKAVMIRSSRNVSKQENLQLQKEIQKTFNYLDSGYMPLTEDLQLLYNKVPASFPDAEKVDGVILIPIDNLQNNPAELILSKLYASKYNLKNGDSIAKIKREGYAYFLNKYFNTHNPAITDYDLMFTKGNGNHTYIVESIDGINNIIEKTEDNFKIKKGNSVYKTDEKGKILYKMQEGDNVFVKEYILIREGESVPILQISDPNVISEVYYSGDYDAVYVKDSTEYCNDFFSHNVKDKYLDSLYGKSKEEVDEINKKRAINLSKKQFTSFLKSLEFTASRIPAQTLQSFMKMKVTQFLDYDQNVAYVSHWQTWLQGSDYWL